MPRGDTGLGVGSGQEQASVSPPAKEPNDALTSDEELVLEVLSASGDGGTLGQLRSRCDLTAERLAVALEGLRSKGLVTRLHTVVESYAARFPGIRVS